MSELGQEGGVNMTYVSELDQEEDVNMTFVSEFGQEGVSTRLT